ncbi:MAG: prolyl oligopeptidase family serine peptidase [Candidatus Aminicenantales bacterium]
MKRKIPFFWLLLTLLFVVSPGGKFLSPGAAVFSGSEREVTPFAPGAQPTQSPKEAEATKARPIELADILSWKNITFADLTPDGNWFAYQLSPNEGDSEVVFRQVKGVKEYRFSRGETPRGMARPTEGALPSREIILAANSRFAAFLVYPKASEAKRLRREGKRITPDACLVDLATGEKKEWPKIKRILFPGESTNWLALHRFPPEAQEREAEKWTGADLILYDLTQKSEINIGNVAEFAFDKQGNYLAWIVDAQGQAGNGVQLRRLKTGEVLVLDSDKASYKGLNWTEKGDGLTVLKGKEDKDYEDKLYSVVAFRNFTSPEKIEKVVFEPTQEKEFPQGMTVSPDRTPSWSEDLQTLIFGLKSLKKKEKPEEKEKAGTEKTLPGKEPPPKEAQPQPSRRPEIPDDEDVPDLVIWHWLDPRLQSQQQVEERRDSTYSYLAIYRTKEKKFLRLADDNLQQVQIAPKGVWAIGYDTSPYELEGNLSGQRFRDVYFINLLSGEKKLALKRNRWSYDASPDGTYFLYYDDGHFYTSELATGKTSNLTAKIPTVFYDEEDDHNVPKPPVRPLGWTHDGRYVLLSDNWDIYLVAAKGENFLNLTQNGRQEKLRYQRRFQLDPEEKGVDLEKPLYISVYGEWTKKGGIARIEVDVKRWKLTGPKLLLWDDAVFSRLLKAKKAEVYLFTKETYKDFPDYYAADALLQSQVRLTEANPQQKNFLWSSGSRLVEYQSVKGKKLQAALFLPANYEPGRKYPTIVYIYEKLSQNLNRYFVPNANGFNKSVYTSHGYAVLMPDIVYTLNDPGMSAVWCVLPALEAAVNSGVVDEEKVGLHGHSWGGYQTSFLITQTRAFKAAVAGAPLTNMISMYSSIYWNTGSANQPIFESSQGRFTGGYWENLEAYIRNSPVYWAKQVETPLLILHNDKDGAVVWNQGIEYFNTLRRLKKPVVMLQYIGENHSLAKPANQKDYTIRMKEFLDHFLLGKEAPEWLEKGIPYLKIKDHLKERVKQIQAATAVQAKEKEGAAKK